MAVCFVHNCNNVDWKTERLDYLLDHLSNSSVWNLLDKIYINNVGLPLDSSQYNSRKITVINHSETTEFFENCTLRNIYLFAQQYPDKKILYLHSKGVSHSRENKDSYEIVKKWVDFMLWGVCNRYCISLLDYVDTVGVQHHNGGAMGCGFWGGNFWWATSSIFKKINISICTTKFAAEDILFTTLPTFANIYSFVNEKFENTLFFPSKEYFQQTLPKEHEKFLSLVQNIKNIDILYGNPENYVNVKDICERDLVNNGILEIPASDKERVQIFGDHLPYKHKHICINGIIFPINRLLRIPYR